MPGPSSRLYPQYTLRLKVFRIPEKRAELLKPEVLHSAEDSPSYSKEKSRGHCWMDTS